MYRRSNKRMKRSNLENANLHNTFINTCMIYPKALGQQRLKIRQNLTFRFMVVVTYDRNF